MGRDSRKYNPDDPEQFKRLADHYQAISDAEQAAEDAAAAGKQDAKPAA